jgi:phage baseplate assembly protein V
MGMDSRALLADISRRLESLIRTGTIAEVDLAGPRVRVASGGLTTNWLPWLELRAGATRTWNPPTPGEQVVLLCPSGEPGTGIVLGALESTAHPVPDSSPSTHVTLYPDGARISYDHASGALTATGIKTGMVQASQKVTVDVPETEITGNVTIDGDLLVKGKGTITQLLSYLAGLSGKAGAGGGSVIQGPITQTGGSLSTDGGVKAAGDVTAGAISLQGHTHAEHGTGGGITGAPL